MEAYISAKAREIARDAHCAICDGESEACRKKIHRTATRIHTLVSEGIIYHGGGEIVPTIEA